MPKKTIYLNTNVVEAYYEINNINFINSDTINEKENVSDEMRPILGILSQIHRSLSARIIFQKLTGLSLITYDDLLLVMREVRKNKACFDTAFKNPELKPYAERKSPYVFD